MRHTIITSFQRTLWMLAMAITSASDNKKDWPPLNEVLKYMILRNQSVTQIITDHVIGNDIFPKLTILVNGNILLHPEIFSFSLWVWTCEKEKISGRCTSFQTSFTSDGFLKTKSWLISVAHAQGVIFTCKSACLVLATKLPSKFGKIISIYTNYKDNWVIKDINIFIKIISNFKKISFKKLHNVLERIKIILFLTQQNVLFFIIDGIFGPSIANFCITVQQNKKLDIYSYSEIHQKIF